MIKETHKSHQNGWFNHNYENQNKRMWSFNEMSVRIQLRYNQYNWRNQSKMIAIAELNLNFLWNTDVLVVLYTSYWLKISPGERTSNWQHSHSARSQPKIIGIRCYQGRFKTRKNSKIEELLVYGYDLLCGVSRLLFEIPHKISLH